MSRIEGEIIKYKDDYGEHEVQITAHITSDTVSVRIDDKIEMVMSDEGYAALVKSIASLEARWKEII